MSSDLQYPDFPSTLCLDSENEPLIRNALFSYTSYYTTQDESSMSTPPPPPRIVDAFVDYRATILLIQSISNMVTGNEVLLTQFWGAWMNVPENSSIILCVKNRIHDRGSV